MRILYKPDRFLASCSDCGAIIDLTDDMNNFFHYSQGSWVYKNVEYITYKEIFMCPVCKEGGMEWVELPKPNLTLASGTCTHCGTDVGYGDLCCNKCGAPLPGGKK